MSDREVGRMGEWSIASEFLKTEWIAWAKRGPMTGSNPLDEPGDVWFQFGATREEAVAYLVAEISALSGVGGNQG